MTRIQLLLSTFLISINLFASTRNEKAESYLKNYAELAVKEASRSGVPASITLAQGMIESSFGESTLSKESNNHFGIKCGSKWKGKSVKYDDDAKNECFRKYPSVYDSYVDHSDFLLRNNRYQSLFNLAPNDYKKWAKGLKKAGYATDPEYANKLISTIEKYELYKYDNPSLMPPTQGLVASNFNKVSLLNGMRAVTMPPNTDIKEISRHYNVPIWQIRRANDLHLKKDQSLKTGDIVFLEFKRSRASREHTQHTVKKGESLWNIAQQYGIRLKALYRKNRLPSGAEVQPGDVISLRKKVPQQTS